MVHFLGTADSRLSGCAQMSVARLLNAATEVLLWEIDIPIKLHKKAPLSRAIELSNFLKSRWAYHFSGITLGQWGFGFIWREKIK
jgi:hypothetical protein